MGGRGHSTSSSARPGDRVPFTRIRTTTKAQLFGGKWISDQAGTDAALALAIWHQWIIDGTYGQGTTLRAKRWFFRNGRD